MPLPYAIQDLGEYEDCRCVNVADTVAQIMMEPRDLMRYLTT